jgi:alpha-glucoside transport system substrate-binding protein
MGNFHNEIALRIRCSKSISITQEGEKKQMNTKRILWSVLSVMLLGSMLMAACAPASTPTAAPADTAAPAAPAATMAPAATAVPADTAAPAATTAPAAKGSFLDRAMAGEFKGTTVTATGPFVDQDAQKFAATMADFQAKTGITIAYQGSKEFEASIKAAIDGGTAPDIIDFPQPGLLASFAKQGKITDLSTQLDVAAVKANYNQYWIDQSMMPGKDGTPIMAGIFERGNGKGFVYYPKKAFDAAGYKVPTTFDELKTLMDQMVKDGSTPWCIGIESGAATGWVATDWMENIMLRTTTPENYDAWVAGKLPFSSPEVTNAATIMAKIWQNPKYVYGGTATIVKTSFGDSTLPMFDAKGPKCFMNMNGNFITSFFPATAKAGVDYGAFYFPPIDPKYGSPMEVAGDIWGATNTRPEVMAVMQYFTKGEHLKVWMQ